MTGTRVAFDALARRRQRERPLSVKSAVHDELGRFGFTLGEITLTSDKVRRTSVDGASIKRDCESVPGRVRELGALVARDA